MSSLIGIQQKVDDHVQRMLAEEAQLHDRIGKLSAFVGTPRFGQLSEVEQSLMASQLFTMQAYSAILGTRLQLATATGVTIPGKQ